jgi:hypothetical protein
MGLIFRIIVIIRILRFAWGLYRMWRGRARL